MSVKEFSDKLRKREQRRTHVRKNIEGSPAKPRMTIFKSNRYLYVQVIDDAAGTTLADQVLQPVADTPSLLASGSGQLPTPCPGLFTGEATLNGFKQDVYLTFLDQAILFGSYTYDTAQTGSNPSYTYAYGVALKQ